MTTASIAGGGVVRVGQSLASPEIALALAAIKSLYNGGGYTHDYISTSNPQVVDTTTPNTFNVYNPSPASSETTTPTFTLNASSQVLFEGISQPSGKPVADGAILVGHAGPELIISDNSPDVIDSGGGSGTVISGSGADTVNASGGPLDIVTGSGKDTVNLTGGVFTVQAYGKDTVNITSGANTVTSASNLLINVSASATASLMLSGNDTISYGSSSDTVKTLGSATVVGTSSGVQVTEGSGLDTTRVGTLAATLIGGTGASSLVGGSLANLFEGGGGGDTMVASKAAGALNTFQFTQGVGGSYTIQNFVNGSHDHIHLVGYGSSNITDISSQNIVGGNLDVTLSDGAQLTLVGYSHLLTNGNFN